MEGIAISFQFHDNWDKVGKPLNRVLAQLFSLWGKSIFAHERDTIYRSVVELRRTKHRTRSSIKGSGNLAMPTDAVDCKLRTAMEHADI